MGFCNSLPNTLRKDSLLIYRSLAKWKNFRVDSNLAFFLYNSPTYIGAIFDIKTRHKQRLWPSPFMPIFKILWFYFRVAFSKDFWMKDSTASRRLRLLTASSKSPALQCPTFEISLAKETEESGDFWLIFTHTDSPLCWRRAQQKIARQHGNCCHMPPLWMSTT